MELTRLEKKSLTYLWDEVFQFTVNLIDCDEPHFPMSYTKAGCIAGAAANAAESSYLRYLVSPNTTEEE